MDQGFPHIVYEKKYNHKQWGYHHGEKFAAGIKELATIRRELMLKKSPHLRNHVDEYANAQLAVTKSCYPELHSELEGMSKASQVSLVDLVILNNYTDFRDVNLADEGCTTLALHKNQKTLSCGQTWDMHSSAKDYLCTIELANGTHLLSLVGCLGMMGINSKSLFVGVNNLNTNDAVNGVLWPALVRSMLDKNNLHELEKDLYHVPVTSGHNYLISDGLTSKHLEISPQVKEVASSLTKNDGGVIYHTNHCLSANALSVQDEISVNSTTYDRYNICEEKTSSIETSADLYDFLTSHDGYPKSICSHFQANLADPSTTCGGAVYDYEKKELLVWRGCPHEDKNFVKRSLYIGDV